LGHEKSDALRQFHALVSTLEYPMWIVTAAAGGERDGCLVGFTTQCSIHPARFLVCLSNKNRTFRIARNTGVLGVHLVPEDRRELAEIFGGETGDEVDKMAQWGWREGPEGVPILDGVHSWFAGRVLERVDLGDHVAHVLEPVAAHHEDRGEPLGFQEVRDIEPGHPA
jgi:flavin reductase (DIM6/NTAB) family NADH-FMN oxidoreductase RutF